MNPKKFSFSEMFANSSNGKTSIGKVAGFLIIVVGLTCFLYGVFFADKDVLNNILLQSIAVLTLGCGLIIGKIIKPTKELDHSESVERE